MSVDVPHLCVQGGGILSRGHLAIETSQFYSNTGTSGGGLYINGGTAAVANSLFFSNIANTVRHASFLTLVCVCVMFHVARC